MPRIRFSLGVSPENAGRFDGDVEALIREHASGKYVCALGSCGLTPSGDAVERRAFMRQVELANELDLPLVISAEGAYDEALACIGEVGVPPRGMLLRAFSGSADELERWVGAGAYVSFDVRAGNEPDAYGSLVALVPKNRLLVESGAPHRFARQLAGSPTRPDQVVFAAEMLRGFCMADDLSDNYAALFGLRPFPK